MRYAKRSRASVVAAIACACLLTGCPTTNTYTTARTVEPRALQQSGMLEVHRLDFVCDSADPDCTEPDFDEQFIPFPSIGYGLRYGLAEHVEVGMKATSFGTFQADLKLQLLRSDALDLAVMPTFTFTTVLSYATLPVLLSLNLGDQVTLTVAPKAGWMFTFIGDSDFVDGALIGATAAFTIRLGRSAAITPGFDYNRLVASVGDFEQGLEFYSVGIGVSFGANPLYGPPPAPEDQQVPPVQQPYYQPPPPHQQQYQPPPQQPPPGYQQQPAPVQTPPGYEQQPPPPPPPQ